MWIFIILLIVSCAGVYVEEQTIHFYYNKSPDGGFSVDTFNGLDFGKGPYATKLSRFITIKNNYAQPYVFRILPSGGGRGALFISPSNHWEIQPNESVDFQITIIVGDDDEGYINGTLHVIRESVPPGHTNTYEMLHLPGDFNLRSLWPIVEVVRICTESYPITSGDLNYGQLLYFRIVRSCY